MVIMYSDVTVVLLLAAALSSAVHGHDHDTSKVITPADCQTFHKTFGDGNEIESYHIIMEPYDHQDPEYPYTCTLRFTATYPWGDILFSFTECDSLGTSCYRQYSYINEDDIYVTILDNDNDKVLINVDEDKIIIDNAYHFYGYKINDLVTPSLLRTFSKQTPDSMFYGGGSNTSLGTQNVSVVISGAGNYNNDWSLYFKMEAGDNQDNYAFSKAAGVFALAVGGTTFLAVLTMCCCCCCKCCCWNEQIRQKNRAQQRRRMINALRKEGYFVSADYGSTQDRDPLLASERYQGVAPPQVNPHLDNNVEPPPSYESVRHIVEPPQNHHTPYQAASNPGYVVDTQAPTLSEPVVYFSPRVAAPEPEAPAESRATATDQGNPFLTGSVPEAVLIDIDMEMPAPAPAYGSADQPAPQHEQINSEPCTQQDLIRFDTEENISQQPNQIVDLLCDGDNMEAIPPPAFGTVD